MKMYDVDIKMVSDGTERRFIEVVVYDTPSSVCISESTREREAVRQVRQRFPTATSIVALSSISP